eukprot:13132659-Alexandrium_andersonii.AAC.1
MDVGTPHLLVDVHHVHHHSGLLLGLSGRGPQIILSGLRVAFRERPARAPAAPASGLNNQDHVAPAKHHAPN